MKIEIQTHNPPEDWDVALRSSASETNLLQSRYWAEVMRKLDHANVYYMSLFDGFSKIGQTLIVKRYPFDRNKQKKRHPLGYLECFDGPVVLDASKALMVHEESAKAAIKIARRSFSTRINIIPAHTSLWANDFSIEDVYKNLGFSIRKWATYLVDLRKSKEDLFKDLKHAARKCINKCTKMDLTVQRIYTFREFKNEFHRCYAESSKYFGRPVNTCSPIPWKEDRNGYYHYYVVKDESKNLLACLGMYVFNGIATETVSAISPMCFQKKIPAQDYIHWHMILEAKRLGCHRFDLAGVNPKPESSKEFGIKKFKEKWGGEYVEYNTYHKTLFLGCINNNILTQFIRKKIRLPKA